MNKWINYKINYDDEQEFFSREIIHMYKTGATDPRNMLAKLMDEEEQEMPDIDGNLRKPKVPKMHLKK